MIHSRCTIEYLASALLTEGIKEPYYYMLIMEGKAQFSVDFTAYTCEGNSYIFLSPYQFFRMEYAGHKSVKALVFHGDFYCIEYHKKEVACNGILFNNIYHQPFVTVSGQTSLEIKEILRKMEGLDRELNALNIPVLKSYLQLILALSSKEKQQQIKAPTLTLGSTDPITDFQQALETHFQQHKDIAFYASRAGLSVNSFSKKIKRHFSKSPSKLIQERTILESKKLLHLTSKPIKEVAATLHFADELYFSRYFKKEVGISPKQFREQVGISIVAEMSI